MRRLLWGRWALTLAAALTICTVLVGGALQPGYSHVADYISELGANGAANGSLVSVAAFLPIGSLIVAGLLLLAPSAQGRGVARVGYWLLLANGASYIGAAFAPCDLGCPTTGSDRQALHNLIGLFGYAVSGVGLLLYARHAATPQIARWIPIALRVSGIVVLSGIVLLGLPDASALRGLIQRIVECALFLALLLIAWRIAPAGPPSALPVR